MEFPILVYKGKGPHERHGGTYDCLPVETESELDVAVAAGWRVSLQDAIDLHDNNVGDQVQKDGVSAVVTGEEQPEIDDDQEPTRDELELKAKELGVPFNSRTSNETLLERIADALGDE